jgi:hypothetical protein
MNARPWLLLLPGIAGADTGGQACTEGAPALRWIRAIEAQDWSAMSGLLAEDSVYADPTMNHFGRDGFEKQGREAIVDFWRIASEDSGAQSIRYEVSRCFETGGVTVLTLDLSISVSGRYWNVLKDQIDLTGYQTTIVRVADDTIASVVDYVDYASADEQVEELQREYGRDDTDR